MKFQILVEDIVHEHIIPVAGKTDTIDLAGGETIDLSNLSKDNILHVHLKKLGGSDGWYGLHDDIGEMMEYRVTFDMSETSYENFELGVLDKNIGYNPRNSHRRTGLKDIFSIYLDMSGSGQILRIRVAFENDEGHTSYTSKSHNIILPPWMQYLAKYKISRG